MRLFGKFPLGEYDELTKLGFSKTGTDLMNGGPILTAGGLIFIGATNDDILFRNLIKSQEKSLENKN